MGCLLFRDLDGMSIRVADRNCFPEPRLAVRQFDGSGRYESRPGLSQGSRGIPVEARGTYRASTLSLLSLRADKGVKFGGHRASFVAEVHNALNSSAGQNSYGALTQSFASQAAFDAARKTTSYFGRTQEIVAPRVLKIGFELDF